ncbi:5-bromo-4-chloroindolyl phosphate hydrolysis family protein [Tranquillimonas alkanivorans]|uniref:5-bromo-4-chloroindolyl phosphate hydrolysis protein n=1 Tax=Tranquillimonas alkanivorans TaxID=441119 RepID=A0A1I5NDR4_9RHOB|nr:5-bromo-4-chloroindolyl phosphate hydrolysis family protein [Tranquillimonas alkanivorans]SFP19899.1 5-bromo-4-chloroindolyl phosphate hydrolysis protein [Tranquillimonas alkanivorans]
MARPDHTGVPRAPSSRMPRRRRTRAGGRVNLLFLSSAPLILSAFWQDPAGLALHLAAGGLLIAAAWLTREGLHAQEAYEARSVAKRPAIPRKLFGSALTGGALALAGFGDGTALDAIIFAILGAGLHVMAFGPDPLSDKRAEGIDRMQSDRVARVVDEAESHLSAMSQAIGQLHDRRLAERVARFQTTAREMCRSVEQDPRDLPSARRYLGVYLLGARDATTKFADLYARSGDAQARADYLSLLDDLEEGFAARTQRMLLDDRSDLDIEIEVLRDRLGREGVLEK